MTAKYLLPCHCGQQIVIEPRQAGETVACGCGALLLAPTLLDMAGLESAPVESGQEPLPPAWGSRHRLRLLGTVLVLTAIVGGVWLWFERPVSRFDAIDPQRLRQIAKGLPPVQTWRHWETMKDGLDRRVDQQYAAAVLRFRAWQVAVAAVGLIGAAMIVAGVAGARSKGPGIKDRDSSV